MAPKYGSISFGITPVHSQVIKPMIRVDRDIVQLFLINHNWKPVCIVHITEHCYISLSIKKQSFFELSNVYSLVVAFIAIAVSS